MKQYALFLAGGSGKRLWPFSRHDVPKQFITLPNGKSLLEISLQRTVPSAHKIIVTTEHYAVRTREIAQHYQADCIVEPCNRNTAAAIAWACRTLRHQTEDATVIIMPTDHIIHEEAAFMASMSYALEYVQHHDVLLLYGSPQKSLSTRFGFVTYAEQTEFHHQFPLHTVQQFHEKPSAEKAQRYYAQPNTLWNMGIFVSKLSTLWNLYEHYAPTLINNLDDYATLIPQSFDHALLEKASQHLVILKHDFGWSDVGTLDEFIPALRLAEKKLEIKGAHNNSVVTDKPVIFAGVSDLVVIELPDMILIAERELAQSPELIAQHVSKLGWEELT